MAQTFYPDYMHPDLFDGETPMIKPLDVELSVYKVTIEGEFTATVTVIAENEDEAGEKAYDDFDCDIDCADDVEYNVTSVTRTENEVSLKEARNYARLDE